MSRLKWVYFALLLAILVGYQNCGNNYQLSRLFSLNGTEIGNPGPAQPSFGTTATLQIRSYTCALLVRCGSTLTLSECHDNFSTTNGIAEALGLPANRYDPYSNLEGAENRGDVRYDAQALERCNQELINLPCTDTRVEQALQTSTGSPIANSAVVYPQTVGNCPNVFVETRPEPIVAPQTNN